MQRRESAWNQKQGRLLEMCCKFPVVLALMAYTM